MDYNENYYECGIESGKSRYQNYRWMPEATMAMAMVIIDEMEIKPHHTILDYGCAKGYLVKALRLLHRQAWGVDISEYAISKVDKEINGYCTTISKLGKSEIPLKFDYCIAKDVFEHIPEEELRQLLKSLAADKMLVVVPLGKDGEYIAPANRLDITHVICQDKKWWKDLFEDTGWKIIRVQSLLKGIKESYRELYPDAHGFYVLERAKS